MLVCHCYNSRTVPLSAMGKSHALRPVVLKKSGRLGVVHCDDIIYMFYIHVGGC